MRKKILFLTLMILICFTINSVCAQSLDNIGYADDGFGSDDLIDCDLHKDSSQKSLKSNALSDKKTTNPVKLTDMKKAESSSVKQTDTAKASNTKSTSTSKTNATKSTTSKSTATKTTANSSSTKKATQNITTLNTQTLAKSSSSYMAYVEKNAKLQDPITISNKKYKSPEYLYLVSKAVSNISKTKVEIKDKLITNYSNSDCRSVNGTINKTEYVQLAKKTVSFIEKNHRAPNWIASSKGNIPRNQLILVFSKCLDQYNKSNKLPSSIKLNDLDLNKMKQKIDSSKKVNSTKTNTTSAKKTNTTSTKKTNATATNTNKDKSLVESTLDSIKSILNNIEKKLDPTNKVLSTTGTKKNTVTVNSSIANVQISSSSTVNVKISAKDNANSGKNTNSGSAKTNTSSAKKTDTTSTKTNTTSAKKTDTSSTKNTNTANTKKTNTTSAKTDTSGTKNTNTANTKKTNTTSTKTNTTSAKKTNTTSTKTNTTSTKTNTTSAKKTNTSSTKKTNTTSSTAKSSSNSKYLNTSVLNDKYLGESLKKYLSTSKNCQVTSKVIKALATTLTSKLKSDYKKGEKIFNWVRDNIGYEKYRNTKKGALKTLKSRGGNCVDHAHLIVALSRAAGLPARYVNANNCKFTSGYVSGHVWAQVLVGNTWVVADATSNRNKFGVVKNWNVKSYKLVGKYSSISF